MFVHFKLALGNAILAYAIKKKVRVIFIFFTVFQQSSGIEVNVTDKDNKLCLYANLMVNFSVSYEVAGDKVSPWFSNSNHKMFSFYTHVLWLVIQKLFCQCSKAALPFRSF